jgi:hypothetical protein
LRDPADHQAFLKISSQGHAFVPRRHLEHIQTIKAFKAFLRSDLPPYPYAVSDAFVTATDANTGLTPACDPNPAQSSLVPDDGPEPTADLLATLDEWRATEGDFSLGMEQARWDSAKRLLDACLGQAESRSDAATPGAGGTSVDPALVTLLLGCLRQNVSPPEQLRTLLAFLFESDGQ